MKIHLDLIISSSVNSLGVRGRILFEVDENRIVKGKANEFIRPRDFSHTFGHKSIVITIKKPTIMGMTRVQIGGAERHTLWDYKNRFSGRRTVGLVGAQPLALLLSSTGLPTWFLRRTIVPSFSQWGTWIMSSSWRKYNTGSSPVFWFFLYRNTRNCSFCIDMEICESLFWYL